MKKIQVLLEDNSYKDIYVPIEFTEDEVTPHLDQLFGVDTWHKYRECA
jgi:hypothetical protein